MKSPLGRKEPDFHNFLCTVMDIDIDSFWPLLWGQLKSVQATVTSLFKALQA